MKMNFFEKCDIYFDLVEDPRQQKSITYKLSDILFMVICGILCGCENLEDIVEILEYKINVIKKYINVERIPCVATFSNVLKVLKVEQLELCMIAIMRNIIGLKVNLKNEKREIAIDGKAIKSTNNHGNPEKALQIVTAYDINELIVVAQTEIKDKTNEITAGRELIDMMDLSNTIITADAIHCQKETMKKIVEKGVDCIIQLKANQKALYNDINVFFDEKLADKTSVDNYVEYQEIEKNGGRIEKRTCYILKDKESYNYLKEKLDEWKYVKTIFCIKREIEIKGKVSTEKSYYLATFTDDTKKLAYYVRNHWKILSHFFYILQKYYINVTFVIFY